MKADIQGEWFSVTRPRWPCGAKRVDKDRKGRSKGRMIFKEVGDLSQIERRSGPDLALSPLQDAEDVKRDDSKEQVESFPAGTGKSLLRGSE